MFNVDYLFFHSLLLVIAKASQIKHYDPYYYRLGLYGLIEPFRLIWLFLAHVLYVKILATLKMFTFFTALTKKLNQTGFEAFAELLLDTKYF